MKKNKAVDRIQAHSSTPMSGFRVRSARAEPTVSVSLVLTGASFFEAGQTVAQQGHLLGEIPVAFREF